MPDSVAGPLDGLRKELRRHVGEQVATHLARPHPFRPGLVPAMEAMHALRVNQNSEQEHVS